MVYHLTKISAFDGSSGFTKTANMISWIRWKDRKFHETLNEPEIGTSLCMNPNRMSFTWLTTEITEIISKSDKEIEFLTKNSHYLLKIITDDGVNVQFPNESTQSIPVDTVRTWNPTKPEKWGDSVFFFVDDLCLSLKAVDYDKIFKTNFSQNRDYNFTFYKNF